jgi:hypothetical protein
MSCLMSESLLGDEQGHPQCRRKATTTGFPSAFGIGSDVVDGAFEPISGGDEVGSEVGGNHEDNSCWKVMLST